MRVVKTDGIIKAGPPQLAHFNGLDVDYADIECLTEDALIANCTDADGLIVLREPISARVIAALGNCRIISRLGVGTDTIDIPAATAAGITVANVPDANIDEVSSHTVAMILSLVRRLNLFDAAVRGGNWDSMSIGQGMRRTASMVLGLLGFGRIGGLVAQKAAAFGFRIIAHDPFIEDEVLVRSGIEPVDLDDLLAMSDVLSLHLGLSERTRFVIDAASIARMKRGAILVNVSRGGLVDEAALASALLSRQLGGAGIDTFMQEPTPIDNPLLSCPNTILTPHMAHFSEASLAELLDKAFLNVSQALRGELIPYRLNQL